MQLADQDPGARVRGFGAPAEVLLHDLLQHVEVVEDHIGQSRDARCDRARHGEVDHQERPVAAPQAARIEAVDADRGRLGLDAGDQHVAARRQRGQVRERERAAAELGRGLRGVLQGAAGEDEVGDAL